MDKIHAGVKAGQSQSLTVACAALGGSIQQVDGDQPRRLPVRNAPRDTDGPNRGRRASGSRV